MFPLSGIVIIMDALLSLYVTLGNIYHHTLPINVPTCVPTYCPMVGEHVQLSHLYWFRPLELFCWDRTGISNA